jgi:hypothetical protein
MTDATPHRAPERRLTAQRLAQYVTRNRCERYLRYALFPSEARRLSARYRVAIEPLSPLLSAAGRGFERAKVDELASRERVVGLANRPSSDFVDEVAGQPPGRTFYDQPQLEGRIGTWDAEGRADLVRVDKHPDGACDLLVVDIKASRRETIGYRLQVAFYARLAREALAAADVRLGAVAGAVAGLEADLDALEPFDLGIYEDEIARLVSARGSDVDRAVRRAEGDARYHLGPACDGCPYNAVCFVSAAERGDLSLVPLISANEKAALRGAGVSSVRDLAGLMEYAERGMKPAEGREDDVARVGAKWPLGARLPSLVQRARAVARRADRTTEARGWIENSGFGALPSEELYPGLVKIFVDAHRDYLEDRVYLLAALVAGPEGEEEIAEIASGPPDDAAERDLLVAWLMRVLPAIKRVAGADVAPLHVYLFDAKGERFLLEALSRHFEALCAIPAFYDLLTTSTATHQSMISFLGEEARERLNLPVICWNLYQVAAESGFKWSEGELDARSTFRARIFDNRRPYERDMATGELRRAEETSERTVWVESGARFGVDVPLEYAYAAWGRLEDRVSYGEASLDDLAALAVKRCHAIRHVENRFAKSKWVQKTPLDLTRLDEVAFDANEVPFSRALEDFLLLEHHASREEALARLSLAPELRAQTGRSAILLCDEVEARENAPVYASFSFARESGERTALEDVGVLRLREGSWVVLNPIREDGERVSAWKLVKGRLAVVEAVTGRGMRLRLLPMNFKDSSFRYRHRTFTPAAGDLYTIDEMVDDLNADKFLEACRNAGTNALYRWILEEDEAQRTRPVRPKRARDAAEFASRAAERQAPRGLTDAPREVVGDHVADRIFVVQGPPGTGKSHTLGLAVLARATALATPARPFRVAVCARTHAATLVALSSIARRIHEDEQDPVHPRESIKVLKVSADPTEPLPEGVERIVADDSVGLRWHALARAPILVVGGTPGGIYNLIKRAASRQGEIDWSEKHFDLVVVDEASQMGIAEALCAAAFLREDGQFVAIGDHRQMPPILAHAWDRESRRDLARAKPHLAIFDYLRERGFASAALDESFRIPAEVADFLNRHIYSEDGIDFRSQNKRRIARVDGLDGWLAAALEPEHAFVVVEHDEAGSQQYNEFEAALAAEIVRAARDLLGYDAGEGVGIVVPHGAQRALLRSKLPEIADAVDTVERFQGGERELIVVSATVSDRDFARTESAFLLEPRRLTVAVSRPKRKLVVLASRAIFDLIPGDLDEYERGALWKHMRRECAATLWEGEVAGYGVRVMRVGEETK